LWSASTSRLVIPPIKLSTVGSRAFPVAAAQVWNGLPEARHLIVITAVFPASTKNLSFSTIVSTPDSLTAYQAALQ